MISIIISSSNPEYLSAVKKNIDETVGIPYEIIAVPNGDGKKGICEVYNAAGAKAKYDVLCFMHEDVILHTQAWGKKVAEILSDTEIGLLGIAGSTYKSLTPAEWACPGVDESRHKIHILQNFKFSERETKLFSSASGQHTKEQVATVDGVWMCIRKTVFDEFKFDQALIKGFHGYDVEYALQVGTKYKIYVTYEVLLEHFSEGNYSEDWLNATLLLHNKHKQQLPVVVDDISPAEARKAERITSKRLMKQLTALNRSTSYKLKVLWRHQLWRTLGWDLFLLFNFKVLIRRY